jgi:uncharacterized membrane protein (DUF485 family)
MFDVTIIFSGAQTGFDLIKQKAVLYPLIRRLFLPLAIGYLPLALYGPALAVASCVGASVSVGVSVGFGVKSTAVGSDGI